MKVLFFTALFSLTTLFGQSLVERLAVPLYFRVTAGIGYDDNLLKFSDMEKSSAIVNGLLPVGTDTFDSAVIKPEFRLLYSPVFFVDDATNIILNFSYADYLQSDKKSHASYALRIEQHLAPYSWLKFQYSYLPDYFLRLYRDSDYARNDRVECTFSLQNTALSYSLKIYRKTWLRIDAREVREYFNPNFTEYDTRILRGGLKLSTDLISNIRLSGLYSAGNAVNTTFDTGYASTAKDRSFELDQWELSANWKTPAVVSEFQVSVRSEHRRYLTDDPNDPLHSGREHLDMRYEVKLSKMLSRELKMQVLWTSRHRKTTSVHTWVEDYKSYSQNQVWLKFSYSFYADMFY